MPMSGVGNDKHHRGLGVLTTDVGDGVACWREEDLRVRYGAVQEAEAAAQTRGHDQLGEPAPRRRLANGSHATTVAHRRNWLSGRSDTSPRKPAGPPTCGWSATSTAVR